MSYGIAAKKASRPGGQHFKPNTDRKAGGPHIKPNADRKAAGSNWNSRNGNSTSHYNNQKNNNNAHSSSDYHGGGGHSKAQHFEHHTKYNNGWNVNYTEQAKGLDHEHKLAHNTKQNNSNDNFAEHSKGHDHANNTKQNNTSDNYADSKGQPCEYNNNENESCPKETRPKKKRKETSRYVAMDCEMVGTGPEGKEDMLARVSLVARNGRVLLDKFVKPQHPVTDYRTAVSGVRPRDMENGEDFYMVQEEVFHMLQGKILVGHALRNDLAVLRLKHPYVNIRDTAMYKPLCRFVSSKGRTPSLKKLSKVILNRDIQSGEHNSIEDARAAMSIYNELCVDWEVYHQKKYSHRI